VGERPKLVAWPLREGQRDAMAAALAKAELAHQDVDAPGRLFWRFTTEDEIPVGFGGLEPYGEDALLRSLLTLPPLRGRGFGAAMVDAIEFEARLHGCRNLWLLTLAAAPFFARLGYTQRDRAVVPDSIRTTAEFVTLCPASAQVLMKSVL
jgi:N-acetylglutamate synthase-like GNAT family acetyltransferase